MKKLFTPPHVYSIDLKSVFCIFVVLFLSLGWQACQKEDLPTVSKPEEKKSVLSFTSKEELQAKLIELHNMSEKDLFDYFQSLYQAGFISLRPHILENQELAISDYVSKIDTIQTNNFFSSNDADVYVQMEELENFIADDIFAGLLNHNLEIMVKDSIYKYTKTGILVAHKQDKEELDNFVSRMKTNAETNIDHSLTEQAINGKLRLLRPFPEQDTGEVLNIESLVEEDVAMVESRSPANKERLRNFAANMSFCDVRDRGIRQFLGRYKTCEDYFDNRNRIRTTYYLQNYGVAKIFGVNVRAQKRRFRIWWATSVSHLVLKINGAAYAVESTYNLIPPITTSFYSGGREYRSLGQYYSYEHGRMRTKFGHVGWSESPISPFKSDVYILDGFNFMLGRKTIKIEDIEITRASMNKDVLSHLVGASKDLLEELSPQDHTDDYSFLYMGVAKRKQLIQFHSKVEQKDNGSRIGNMFDFGASIGYTYSNGKGRVTFPGGFSEYKDIAIDFAGAGMSHEKMRGSRVLITE